MLFISKGLSGFHDRSLNVINRKALPQHIVFCDEDYITFIERFILFSGFCYVCIDQAAVVSGSLHSCAMIAALDLDVVHMILLIDRQNIKSDGAPLKVFNSILAGGFCDLQIITFQNNLEQKFSALCVLKDFRHEVIIEQAQIVKTLQIFFVLSFKI
jgi:hypothetical protein